VAELAPDAEVFTATTAAQDPHYVQARPSLIAQLRRADLLVCTGAELEIGWLPALQRKANNARVRDNGPGAFLAAQYTQLVDIPERVDRSMGDVHASGNPHFYLDPARIAEVARALTQRLSELDPDQVEQYRAAGQRFQTRWQEARQRWTQQARVLEGMRLVAYHTNFRYLFQWTGITQVGDLEPKPGLPPTSGHLSQLLQQLDAGTVDGIVYAGYHNDKGARWLATRLAVPQQRLVSTVAPEAGVHNLFELFDGLLQQLKELRS
jgi:zinc/manganese transport system substrate-binding protein